jgi:hypothetical protein
VVVGAKFENNAPGNPLQHFHDQNARAKVQHEQNLSTLYINDKLQINFITYDHHLFIVHYSSIQF